MTGARASVTHDCDMFSLLSWNHNVLLGCHWSSEDIPSLYGDAEES